MKTREDLLKQAHAEIDTALAKRRRAYQMIQDADEEIVMARMKISDIQEGRYELQKMVNRRFAKP